jgi:hypothetical protein
MGPHLQRLGLLLLLELQLVDLFTKRDELVLKREVLSGQDLLKIAAERSEESEGK